MTTEQLAVRKNLYRIIRGLPEDKMARVVGYIQSVATEDDEPPLTADEEDGIRIANMELSQGKGRSFKEAMKDLW